MGTDSKAASEGAGDPMPDRANLGLYLGTEYGRSILTLRARKTFAHFCRVYFTSLLPEPAAESNLAGRGWPGSGKQVCSRSPSRT